MNPLFQLLEDFAALSAEDLHAYIDGTLARVEEVADDPRTFAVDGRTLANVFQETEAAVASLAAARDALAALEAGGESAAEGDESEAPADDTDAEEVPADESEADPELAANFAALADEARREPEVAAAPPAVVAAATPPARRRAPARSTASRPQEESAPRVSLVAAAGVDGYREGSPFEDEIAIAQAMMDRRRRFGNVAEGSEEDIVMARADWSHLYPPERTLTMDEEQNAALVAAALDQALVRRNFEERRTRFGGDIQSLLASGGLCAPVTPYYNLQMVSSAVRPVRAALPAFNADRGGIRYARPATLAAISSGVGSMTAAQDAAGGTLGVKSCQVVDCPPFQETDVDILYHCLRFGNLGARTFPERVVQWNNLVLAAHARLAERTLLTAIDGFSTQVVADSIAAGASGELLSQIRTAAAGMRSRHRMDPDAILRVLLPRWVLDLVVSDVYRSTFGRWDMTEAKFITLLRDANVEPSFYIDSAAGKSQEFGVQSGSGSKCSSSAGALLPFPFGVTWYLFPEGTFLYVDGGTLELGLVRDSVLNSTNDFEIFGESFENVAYVGVESLAVTSNISDIGVTAGTTIPQSGISTALDYCVPFKV